MHKNLFKGESAADTQPAVSVSKELDTSSLSSNHTNSVEHSEPEHRLPSSLWSWDQSIKDKITRLSINAGIRSWIEADPEFHNWVKTCVANHVASGHDETECPVPDRWRAEVGQAITVITANYIPGKRNHAGGQDAHTYQAGVFHIMQGP